MYVRISAFSRYRTLTLVHSIFIKTIEITQKSGHCFNKEFGLGGTGALFTKLTCVFVGIMNEAPNNEKKFNLFQVPRNGLKPNNAK